MDDLTKNRIGNMLDLDIKAFEKATPYDKQFIITVMIEQLEKRLRRLQFQNKKQDNEYTSKHSS